MNTQDRRKITQGLTTNGTTPGFMPGFGNDHETEALPGAFRPHESEGPIFPGVRSLPPR